jgi:phytoene dehydrogenase-like protein
MTVATPSIARRRAHATLPERVDVAVIGSGLGGLVAAANLAQRGLSVAVFEGHYTAGGCATQFERGPKRARYHFDVGLHYVGDCGPEGQIPRLLREVGVDVSFRPMDADGFDTLVFPGLRFRIPAEVDRYRDRLLGLFPREGRAIDRYVSLLRAVMVASRAMDRDTRPPLYDLPRLALAGLRVARHRNATIGEVLDAIGARDPALRAVFLGQSGDYGLPPSKASAMLHLGLAGHYFRGAYYPEGGGQVIADRLAARIESLGGSVHLRHPIERVVIENGRAVGVRVAARGGDPACDVRADVVVSNADLKRTLLELVGPEHLPSEWVTRSERFEMTAALIITFLGVESTIQGMSATNYWQFDGFDMESFYRDDPSQPITPHGCYITSASLKDPAHALHHAPEGVTNVEVMSIVPGALARWQVHEDVAAWGYKKNDAYHAIKQRIEEDMIARLDRLFPGTASRIVFRETATPVSHMRYTGATDGTGYGLAATPAQFFEGRPGYRGPIAGLYLCGASTRAGHGIVGAMSSGRSAARRVLKDLGARQAAAGR